MSKTKTKSKTRRTNRKKTAARARPTPRAQAKPAAEARPKTRVQEALQTTFILKGTLKRVQLMYLRVGELLAKVRDEKLYAELNHPDMDDYAQERLGLGRSSLYNYLRIYDWVRRAHPEWLESKGFIPDLSDVGDLMWMEDELARPDLPAARRTLLEELRGKGLAGKLRRSDVRKVREPRNTRQSGLKQMISRLRSVRERAAELASVPPEALAHLDAAIQILVNESALRVAGLSPLRNPLRGKWRENAIASPLAC